ncbi:MAG: hydrogenase nickel incorporation protein HypB [Dechloromonas sp.]|nr:hydrogenase nickel incorporation protein HypB [Dechloromonas sp.]
MCTTCGCGGDSATIDHHHAGHPYAPRRRAVEPSSKAAPENRDALPDAAAGAAASAVAASAAAHLRHVSIEQDLLARNDAEAAANRRAFAEAGVFALNLVSSPGSGKTTLLVKTIERLAGRIPLAVIEGDQQTSNDAERIRATGAPATQINTGKGCHLDARMVGDAMTSLPLMRGGLLMIENVGNLVCPAAFDLGEAHKVVILSVTEGEDKPLKYPDMFRAADLMLLNKCDLLPYLQFDVVQAEAFARRVNPDIRIIRVSATSGLGMDEWVEWLAGGCAHTCGSGPGRDGVAGPDAARVAARSAPTPESAHR